MNGKTEARKKTEKRQANPLKKDTIVFLIVLLAGPLIQWLIFYFGVNLNTVLLAFKDRRTGVWTLDNYSIFFESLTTKTGTLYQAFGNTLAYFLTNIFILIPIPLFVAYVIYKKILGYGFFRVLFYLPVIVPGIVMVTAYTRFISPNGPLGAIMQFLGKPLYPEGLLADASTSTLVILIYSVWTGLGTNMLLFGGALTRIPPEILEAAKIDGCGPFRELTNIIAPLIWPTLSTLFVFSCTGIFTASGPILLFAAYGAKGADTISYWIFTQVYGDGTIGGTGQYNLVSAAGLFFTAVGVPIILLAKWLLEKVPAVEY